VNPRAVSERAAVSESAEPPAGISPCACIWCGRPFTPRTTGGHAQRYCSPFCRRAFDAAGRRWVTEAIADGSLTLDQLRNGVAATRALIPEAISPKPVPRPINPPL
jgi:hypothetical protein